MAFIDGNDVIQQLTAPTADPTFRNAIGMSVQLRRMATLKFDVSE
jgi:hypothetical protein